MSGDTDQDVAQIKSDFNGRLVILEHELQDKIQELQDKAFFAEDVETIKTEGIMRGKSMETAYQEFVLKVRRLADSTKDKIRQVCRVY